MEQQRGRRGPPAGGRGGRSQMPGYANGYGARGSVIMRPSVPYAMPNPGMDALLPIPVGRPYATGYNVGYPGVRPGVPLPPHLIPPPSAINVVGQRPVYRGTTPHYNNRRNQPRGGPGRRQQPAKQTPKPTPTSTPTPTAKKPQAPQQEKVAKEEKGEQTETESETSKKEEQKAEDLEMPDDLQDELPESDDLGFEVLGNEFDNTEEDSMMSPSELSNTDGSTTEPNEHSKDAVEESQQSTTEDSSTESSELPAEQPKEKEPAKEPVKVSAPKEQRKEQPAKEPVKEPAKEPVSAPKATPKVATEQDTKPKPPQKAQAKAVLPTPPQPKLQKQAPSYSRQQQQTQQTRSPTKPYSRQQFNQRPKPQHYQQPPQLLPLPRYPGAPLIPQAPTRPLQPPQQPRPHNGPGVLPFPHPQTQPPASYGGYAQQPASYPTVYPPQPYSTTPQQASGLFPTPPVGQYPYTQTPATQYTAATYQTPSTPDGTLSLEQQWANYYIQLDQYNNAVAAQEQYQQQYAAPKPAYPKKAGQQRPPQPVITNQTYNNTKRLISQPNDPNKRQRL